MTPEHRNTAQDILDNLLRDAYSRGFADAKSEVKKLEEQNTMMLESLKTLVSIFDPDKQSMYNFARHYIQTAKEIIYNVEGEKE